jgi:hypothetical protein
MMHRQKIAGLIFVLLCLLYCIIEAKGEGDLYIYLQAAGLLGQGGDIYLHKYIDEQYQYYYSVIFALFLQPFYTLPYYGVKLLWLLLNMSLFLHLVWLLAKSDLVNKLQTRQKNLFLILTLVFSARFFHENMHASQISIVILWCCIVGLHLIWKKKIRAGAFLIALGINLKLLPLVLVPYLFYRGEWRSALYILVFIFFLFAVPAFAIGYDYNLLLLQSWWSQINPQQVRHVLDVDERSFHGLSTLLATLLVKEVPDVYALPLARNIADLPYETVSKILLSARLILLGFALYFVRSLPFQQAKSLWQRLSEQAYLLLLIPLIFPHQQHYAFIFTCPAFALLLYQAIREWKVWSPWRKRSLSFLLVLIYLSGNLKLILGEFNRYYEHYKILTYGTLLLIPLLAWSLSQYRTEEELSESGLSA